MLRCTISYSHLAFDPDFDSLSYNWAYPLQGSSFSYNTATPLSDTMSYQTAVYPFSVNNQLPSTPAGPLNLNNNTGEISFIATGLQGVFLTCVKVTTVKCFQVISEVFREVQVVLTDCAGFSSNTPNFFSTSWNSNLVFIHKLCWTAFILYYSYGWRTR